MADLEGRGLSRSLNLQRGPCKLTILSEFMGLKRDHAGKALSESQAWCRPVTLATWRGREARRRGKG